MTTAATLAPAVPFRQMLDEAVRHARRHFKRIYPAAAIPLALSAGALPLVQGLFFGDVFASAQARHTDMTRVIVGGGLFVFAMLVFIAVSGLGYGAMFAAATDALAGREVSMRRAWGAMVQPRALGTFLLVGFVVALGSLFCLLPGLYLGLLYAFIVPVMIEESRFGRSAMGRSSELARYNPQRQFDADPRLHVFVTVIVGSMLGYTINLLVQLPFIILQQLVMFRDVAGGQRPDPAQLMARMTWVQVPTQMLGALTNSAVYLYVSFGIALLFFDVRRRKEGLDLEAAVASLVERHRARRQP